MREDIGYEWWTTKHAFFSYMGGFMLRYEQSQEVVVMEDQIVWLHQQGHVVLSEIPYERIDEVPSTQRLMRCALLTVSAAR